MVKKYSDPIGVDTIRRLSKEASTEIIGIEELINKYSDDFLNFEYSVVNGAASLIYCEFIRKMRNVTTPVPHIDTPKIYDVMRLCNIDSELMELIKNNIVDAIKDDQTYNEYKSSTVNKLDIIELDSLSEYRDHWINKMIIPQMGQISSIIDQKFYGHPNQTFRENREIELFNRANPTLSQVAYIANQAVCNYICSKENVLDESHKLTLDIHDTMEITPKDIIMLIDEMGICPIYISLPTLINDQCWPIIQFVTGIIATDVNKISVTHTNSHLYHLKLE